MRARTTPKISQGVNVARHLGFASCDLTKSHLEAKDVSVKYIRNSGKISEFAAKIA